MIQWVMDGLWIGYGLVMEAAAAAVAAAVVWPTAITRRNIKQQDNVNEQTSMLLFVVVTLLSLGIIVIESAHKHTLQNIAVFSGI